MNPNPLPKRYDAGHAQSLTRFMAAQRDRIAYALRPRKPRLELWMLEIRGHKPAQIALEDPPILSQRVVKDED